jgi:tetratricopeptide (TPR) repeat protein
MQVLLQPPTPFDQSLLWKFHDAYFASRGIAAWNNGDIPYYSTSNFATAHQHAGFLVDLVLAQYAEGRLSDDQEIWVLEVGSGLGRFAANFLRALEVSCGPAGEDVFSRIRYILSDYSEKSLREATTTHALKPHVDAGRVIPALLDLRDPTGLAFLDGRPVDMKLHMVISNYVCCVVPLKNMQHRLSEGWFEQWVRLEKKVEDGAVKSTGEIIEEMLLNPTREGQVKSLDIHFEWRPRPLELVYPRELHQKVLKAVADLVGGDATVGYPHGFIDFLDGIAQFLAPGGVFLVNDYGSADKRELVGLNERRSQIYGNSIANSVNFAIFDALAQVTGWHILRSRDLLGSLHTAAIRPALPWTEREEQGFARNYVRSRAGDDILDHTHIARLCVEKKDWDRAIRYFRRAIELEPENPDHYYKAGDAAIDAGHHDLAIAFLEQGLSFATPDHALDFEFQLGRATCLTQDYKASIRWYETALTKENHPTTWTNLGVLYESEGRYRDAFNCYKTAMTLDPKYARARERMELLKDLLWRKTVEDFAGLGAKDPLRAFEDGQGVADNTEADAEEESEESEEESEESEEESEESEEESEESEDDSSESR